MHGSRCYGCGGSGYKLTKRGLAANRWLNAQRMVTIADLKVGDKFLLEGFQAGSMMEPNRWMTVMEMVDIASGLSFKCVDEKRVAYDPINSTYFWPVTSDYRVRKQMTIDQRRELHAATLAYQATLTKEGVPSKRKGKSA
jgi:hypothetical protein